MSTERIISEEGETSPELETPQENNEEPEIQPQNIVDYQNIQGINQPSKFNKNCCFCCHCFLALLVNSLIIVISVFEYLAAAEGKIKPTIFDIFVDISIIFIYALIIIYVFTRKENILNAFTFYQLFTLFWALASLFFSLLADKSYYKIGIYQGLKGGKFFLNLVSFIINLSYFGAKRIKKE